MKKIIAVSISCLLLIGCAHRTVSGLICRDNIETGQWCTIYDPKLRQMCPIDPAYVTVTCDIYKYNI